MDETDPRTGEPVKDATMMLLLNAAPEPVTFTLPPLPECAGWEVILDTEAADGDARGEVVADGGCRELRGRSLVVLCQQGRAAASGGGGADA